MSPDEKDKETEALEANEKVKADEKPKAKKKPAAKPKPKAEAKAKKSTEDVEDKPKAAAKPKKAAAKPKAAAKKDEPAEAKQDEAAEENEAEAAEAAGEPPAEDAQAKPRARRGGAAAAGSTRRAKRRPTDGAVDVRAQAKYVRTAPRKARLVIDHIRGKSVADARAILTHTPRAASRDVLKLLDSAIANAENNHELVADELKIARAFVDEGPTLKRFRPRAQGRATRIRKRTSHMTIHLTVKD
jgi:ribosomal protein L22